MNSNSQLTSSEVVEPCGNCQHSVDIQRTEQIVCLPHLTIRHPVKNEGCCEFEGKRKKYPLFENLGDNYPSHLEEQYGRILKKIEQLWESPKLHDYFSDLLIDKRGGRKGFPKEVLQDIIKLREFRELETFQEAEKVEMAICELDHRGINLKQENFFRALNEGDQELIDLFIRANFNINIFNEHGNSPLMLALKKGFSVIAKIILLAGADVNVRDKLGLTPLLVACGKTTQGYKDIAETLIKKGAFINVRDALGNTPLLLSLSGGTIEIAKLLIERGADISARTRKGETAQFLARKINTQEGVCMVELLINKGIKY